MSIEDFENLGNDGWVEWPSFPENENKFDWSMSYEQMEKKYPPHLWYKESQEPHATIAPYNSKKKRRNWLAQRKKESSDLKYPPLPQPQIMSHYQWKKNKTIITESVKKDFVESPTIAAEKRRVEQEAKERSLFISRMTIEQFQLMQKHGWKMAQILTEPEPNFHIKD